MFSRTEVPALVILAIESKSLTDVSPSRLPQTLCALRALAVGCTAGERIDAARRVHAGLLITLALGLRDVGQGAVEQVLPRRAVFGEADDRHRCLERCAR